MSCSFAFFSTALPWEKMEPFLDRRAIQDTNESSSDRLIKEGRPLCATPLLFFQFQGRPLRHPNWAASSPGGPYSLALQESRYWLRKHRSVMPVDSGRWFTYLVCLMGLKNP